MSARMKSSSASSGLRPDIAFQGSDGCLAARDEVGDDRRIGLECGWRAAKQRRGGTLVRKRPDEAVALEDRLESVQDQRIGFPGELQEGGAARRRGEPFRHVDEQPAAGLGHGRGRRHLPEREPEGLHGVGHHLLVADGEIDVVLPVVGLRDREQRRDRPALDDLEVAVEQAPFDVLRARRSALRSAGRARRAGRPAASVNAGCACRSGSIGCSWVPPAGEASMASCLSPTVLATTSPSRTLKTSAFTRPETSASPSPKLASTVATFRSPVTGSAVNRIPDTSAKTIRCTTTAISTFRWSTPFRRR